MKIDSSTRAAALTGNTAPTARGAKSTPPKQPGSAQDSVTLSGASAKIQALESHISEASGFDAAKVEAIKQAISEGRFTIHPEAIADKLIASARELLAKHKS